MKRILAVGALVVLTSIPALAGSYLTNDTGETIYGLRVVFSEPVTITSFGDVLSMVEPRDMSSEFIFLGGALDAWEGHWLNWKPAEAQLVSSEWLNEVPGEFGGQDESTTLKTEVVGDLLNPAYFVHPAYVMQGISDRDEIFSMPLDGIPEIDLCPLSDPSLRDSVQWSVTSENTDLVEASIEDDTLLIWASTDSDTGTTFVTLHACATGRESAHVVVPVTVFRSDRTLPHFAGKTDYFVPWSPQLDINRIVSVEKHVVTYGKDEGQLDRTIQWSRWMKMAYLKDVTLSTLWPLELCEPGTFWPQSSQFAFVDVILSELRDVGFDTVRIKDPYFSFGLTATEFQPVYDNSSGGVSKRPEESCYVINEAHRLGLRVIMSNWIGIDTRSTAGAYMETWQATPSPIDEYWANYQALMIESMEQWQTLGVDIAAIADSLELILPRTPSNMQRTNDAFESVADASREFFDGPLTCFTSCQWLPGTYIAEAPFWEALDILGPAINDDYRPLVTSFDASVEEIEAAWEDEIDSYFEPFQQQLNKPLIVYHGGCFSVDGGATWGVQFEVHYPERLATQHIDLEEQRRWYEATLSSFDAMDGFYGLGAFWYGFVEYMSGGVNDIGETPRLKLAEYYLSDRFGGTAHLRPIRIDGDVSDWMDTAAWAEDPAGDNSVNGDDILSLQAAMDDTYLYLALRYTEPPQGHLIVSVDTDEDGEWNYNIGMSPSWGDENAWLGNVMRNDGEDHSIGLPDITAVGDVLEARVHLHYLDDYEGPLRVLAVDGNGTWSEEDDEIPFWTLVPKL